MSIKVFCTVCYSEYIEEPLICEKCAYPFSGNEREKQEFISSYVGLINTVKDANNALLYSRYILFIIGGINILIALRSLVLNQDDIIAMPQLFISLMMVILGFVSFKEPFFALLLGFLSLILLYGVVFFIEPLRLLHGIFWKILFLSGMIWGLYKVWMVERIKKISEAIQE